MTSSKIIDDRLAHGMNPESVPQLRPQAEGVFLYPDRLEVLKGNAALAGNVYQVGPAQQFVDSNGNVTNRVDRYLRIEIDGYGLGLRQTLPQDPAHSGPNIVRYPGFLERIEDGSAHEFHTSLATEMPDSLVVSVASDGTGPTGKRLTRDTVRDHGMREMGERRAKLLQALYGSEPIILNPCSMGTVIEHYMKEFDAHNGHNLNIYSIDYAHAKVTPERAALIMFVLFPILTASDVGREVIRSGLKYGTEPVLAKKSMLQGRSPEALALLWQVASLAGGIALYSLDNMNRHYPGGVSVSGAWDPLLQPKLQRHLKRGNPSMHIINLPFKGHGIAADGRGGGIKTAHIIDRYDIPSLMAKG